MINPFLQSSLNRSNSIQNNPFLHSSTNNKNSNLVLPSVITSQPSNIFPVNQNYNPFPNSNRNPFLNPTKTDSRVDITSPSSSIIKTSLEEPLPIQTNPVHLFPNSNRNPFLNPTKTDSRVDIDSPSSPVIGTSYITPLPTLIPNTPVPNIPTNSFTVIPPKIYPPISPSLWGPPFKISPVKTISELSK